MAVDDTFGPGSPEAWLRHAWSDLTLAEMPAPDGVLLETLCFHAQQAAEKAIKAVLIAVTTESPPRSHDLVFLVDLIDRSSAPGPVPIDALVAQRLTQYAVTTRYPSDMSEINEAEWQDSVGVARAVLTWSEEVIGGMEH